LADLEKLEKSPQPLALPHDLTGRVAENPGNYCLKWIRPVGSLNRITWNRILNIQLLLKRHLQHVA
jgi:hypothetical protein